MSDTKSLDLETAQRLYIAAGHPEQAEAAGFVLDAVRNMVQGEWGKSFVASLERVLGEKIGPVADDVSGLRTDVQRWAMESATRLGKLEQGYIEVVARLDHKREEIDQIKRELAEIKAWRDAQEHGS